MSENKSLLAFGEIITQMNKVVFKEYLNEIENIAVKTSTETMDDALRRIRMRRVRRIVYDKHENAIDKLSSVLSSLHSNNSCCFVLLNATPIFVDIFIGTKKMNSVFGSDAGEVLDSSFKGNFPGTDLGPNIVAQNIEEFLEPIKSSSIISVASVAGIPSLKNENAESFSQGLEKIIDGMRGRSYSAVILAQPVSRSELEKIEGAYQDIYTALAPLESRQITLSENESRAIGDSLAEGITHTLAQSIGDTQTSTEGSSFTSTTSTSKTQSDIDIKKALAMGATGAVTGGAYAGLATGGLGAGPGALLGFVGGFGTGLLGGSKTSSESESTTTNSSYSSASSHTHTNSEANSTTHTNSDTTTTGSGKSLQISEKNRRITAYLNSIDAQLERIEECKSYGMWNWGAYFVGKHEIDVKLGAELYSGVFRGDATGLERNNIAIWRRPDPNCENKSEIDNFSHLLQHVAQLSHPIFQMPSGFATPTVTHTSMVSTKELALAMGLPRKSLPGTPVIEAVSFGRSVNRMDSSDANGSLTIGCITNYGIDDSSIPVNLDMNSLASHTFVTGSTGSGKSNAIYSIINSLYDKKVPFLIIEPAKGEYKQVFGGYKNVQVFGTNPTVSPLLRINPFSFPATIHVMEHIDRLIEILNAVWPMYAAMPAILKEAVELTYERLGWDLLNSDNATGERIFPDFYDLMSVLPDVISKSDYSQEIKGNYAGALITRVKSLTNGYYKTIFQKNEIGSELLFDQFCIIDLSRIGSTETKSLLMGVVFLKLQEYRMSQPHSPNSHLRHVTVIEEAHNLLRRMSGFQSGDSANVQGKSVEMISNAIAEMRTYGEGFIIADQAPGLLDPSVIRNTNTKIILRLPDYDDRNIVGKSAKLNAEQIEEIARLRRGCAAVYQNDWLEPVLCQFGLFNSDKKLPFNYLPESTRLFDERKRSMTEFLKLLVGIAPDLDVEVVASDLFLERLACYFPNMVVKVKTRNDLANIASTVINLSKILDQVPNTSDVDSWIYGLKREIGFCIEKPLLTQEEQIKLFRTLMQAIILAKPQNKEIIESRLDKVLLNSGGGF